MEVIDAHTHIGAYPCYSLTDYFCKKPENIKKIVSFAPVELVYDRMDDSFEDNDKWREKRKRANQCLVDRNIEGFEIFPYYFVWNDFDRGMLDRFKGVKWHRHAYEARYDYSSDKCKEFLKKTEKLGLPLLIEDEFSNTLRMIEDFSGRIVIPHLGILNGGYDKLKDEGVFDNERVYVDSALAPVEYIENYVDNFGDDRIFFGSDFPFGMPKSEMRTILRMYASDETKKKILSENIKNFLNI